MDIDGTGKHRKISGLQDEGRRTDRRQGGSRMDDLQCKVAIGAMLHDIGKVLYRSSDGRKHSRSGHDFLRDEIGIRDKDILEQVLYHHADLLKESGIAVDSPAYITYVADNIASAADRRRKDEAEGVPGVQEDARAAEKKKAPGNPALTDSPASSKGFNRTAALGSVFNILNGNHCDMHYLPSTMDRQGKINYPTKDSITFDSAFYGKIEREIRSALKDLADESRINAEYINSLLSVLEAYLTYIPSSTDLSQQTDISLYDHMKLTAAIGNCILPWLREQGIADYRAELFAGAGNFYKKEVFYLYSMDLSGIQSFIYRQFGTDDVLKNLRARSFYLEIMMENFIDTLLHRTGLSRANLIYSGGGHAYLILPNTAACREAAEDFSQRVNAWLRETFGIDIFLGTGGAPCSANTLENVPEGSYQELFRTVSRKISRSKSRRYTASQLRMLNKGRGRDGGRECRICHRSDLLTQDNLCGICSGLTALSAQILDRDFFVIRSEEDGVDQMPVFEGQYLQAADIKKVRAMIAEDDLFICAYSKNEFYTGYEYATNLWVADYSSARTLGELVKDGKGISRLGVIRADVDNLGTAFVSGFPKEYQTLSRAAAFSRTLSMFFKWHVNALLKNGGYRLEDGGTDIREMTSLNGKNAEAAGSSGAGPRRATVIYAGGDDLFIVGAWKDIIEFSVDLHRSLEAFSIGTLKISAGIGIFDEKYPISYIASQCGDLESASKEVEGKNAVTLFTEKENTYHWEELIDEVLGEKFRLLYRFFSFSKESTGSSKESSGNSKESIERGKAFLYRILQLFRESEDKINLARLAYLLARLEPSKKGGDEKALEYARLYDEFKKKLYQWQRNEKDRRQFITAIYIYAYLTRGEE